MPSEFINRAWESWPRGTWSQSLALYRSADPERLAAAGEDLEGLRCPALVVWGTQDPYLPAELGRSLAARLPEAELHEAPEGGHWPWIEDPGIVDRVCRFLER